MSRIGVWLQPKEEPYKARAQALATQLRLPLTKDFHQYPLSLIQWEGRWGLRCREFPEAKPLVIDFLQGDWKRRRTQVKGSGDILSKALRKVKGRKAVDATAGLGRDSLHLLALGFEVIAVEQSVVLAFLFRQALSAALACEGQGSGFNFLKILHADARLYLSELCHQKTLPDVVFLDPMFPQKKKSALSGKEMQVFHHLFHHRPQAERELLKIALDSVTDRVVVKRPLVAPPIFLGARHQYKGKSVRYDVYFPGDKLTVPEVCCERF